MCLLDKFFFNSSKNLNEITKGFYDLVKISPFLDGFDINGVSVDFRLNPDFDSRKIQEVDGFLFYKYYVEIFEIENQNVNVSRESYNDVVAQVNAFLKDIATDLKYIDG